MPYEDRTKPAEKRPHAVSMEERKHLSVSGVTEVDSFDEHEIVLETSCGCLVISGEELNISRLSTEQGDVNVQGHITSLRYEQPQVHQSVWTRLFR